MGSNKPRCRDYFIGDRFGQVHLYEKNSCIGGHLERIRRLVQVNPLKTFVD